MLYGCIMFVVVIGWLFVLFVDVFKAVRYICEYYYMQVLDLDIVIVEGILFFKIFFFMCYKFIEVKCF